VRTRDLRLVRNGLTDGKDIGDGSDVIARMAVDSLAYNEEVGRLGLVGEDGGADEVVVDDLSDFATVHIAEEEWFGVADVEEGRLTKVQLRRVSQEAPRRLRRCALIITHVRNVLVLVVLFPIVIDNGRAHPIAAHDRRIFLLRHDQTRAHSGTAKTH
jgi:hypothetical protein